MCILDRLVRWRVLLPTASLLLTLACASSTAPESDATMGADFRPVANIDQIMDALVIPSAEFIFDAAIYENGELVTAPETLEEWAAVEYAALAIAEAGNLLLVPPRMLDAGDWVARSHDLTDSAVAVLGAARAQSVDELLNTGSVMYLACVNCHEQYIADPLDLPAVPVPSQP